MWFDDENISGSRLFSSRRVLGRKHILRMNTRQGDKKNAQKLAAVVLVPVFFIVVIAAVWTGMKYAGKLLFSSNDRFIIKNLYITGGEAIPPDRIREYTQIQEGKNLFDFNISNVRNDFVKQVHNVKTMEISRQLPDTMKIRVEERAPLARIGRKSLFFADAEGYVFGLRSGYGDLPVLAGYRDPNLKPGSRLCGMSLAALEVLEACYNSKYSLHIDEVEVNNPEYIILYVPDGGKVKEIDLAWKDMGKRTAESKKHLMGKLVWILKTLNSTEGQRLMKIDATFEGKFYATGSPLTTG